MTLIRSFFANQLKRHLPNRMKRVAVVASLSFLFSKKDRFDPNAMRKLNVIMTLCHNERAMGLPVALSKVIWHGNDGMEVFDLSTLQSETDAQVEQRVDSILRKIPSWLKYDEDEFIEEDIRVLIDNRSVLMA